ncbi:MAG: hypothetical protein Q9211_004310, partial [Gyalolechia sp. 1 TL-2023]
MAKSHIKKQPSAAQKAARKDRKRQRRHAARKSHFLLLHIKYSCLLSIPRARYRFPNAAQRAYHVSLLAEATSSNTTSNTTASTIPLDTIPGTNTRVKEALQVRRWLFNERVAPLQRFSAAAINETRLAFDKKPATRAANPFAALSAEAKNIVAVVEREREEAKQAGVAGDWWAGNLKKGVTPEEAQAYKAARKMAKALDEQEEQEEEEDEEDEEDV